MSDFSLYGLSLLGVVAAVPVPFAARWWLRERTRRRRGLV